MRILAVGGGSGGHVTPVVAVISQLKQQSPSSEIRFWCDRKFAHETTQTVHGEHPDVLVSTIPAGKFRRYHQLSLWRQLVNFRTIVLPNIIDTIQIAAGIAVSTCKLLRWRPDVVFTKGGFVCLPVGIAARMLRIPIVVHDSDTHAGLTNRILAKWAVSIGTGAPLEHYDYPKSKAHFVGIPVAASLQPISETERTKLQQKLGMDPGKPLVVVTGGGLGAKRVNTAVMAVLSELLVIANVFLVCGGGQYDELRAEAEKHNGSSFRLEPFVASKDFVTVLGAADVVVSRAGATTMLELAALAKPTILIPNAQLTGGHQLKNARMYEEGRAAVVLDESELSHTPAVLVNALNALLNDKAEQKRLSVAIHGFATPNAARDMAALVLAAKGK